MQGFQLNTTSKERSFTLSTRYSTDVDPPTKIKSFQEFQIDQINAKLTTTWSLSSYLYLSIAEIQTNLLSP
jgi:hypothetical protein